MKNLKKKLIFEEANRELTGASFKVFKQFPRLKGSDTIYGFQQKMRQSKTLKKCL